jgi:hypothetical protein
MEAGTNACALAFAAESASDVRITANPLIESPRVLLEKCARVAGAKTGGLMSDVTRCVSRLPRRASKPLMPYVVVWNTMGDPGKVQPFCNRTALVVCSGVWRSRGILNGTRREETRDRRSDQHHHQQTEGLHREDKW